MAERDPEQDSLFKEIDDDLRHEHYAKLWKKYGKYVIGGAILFVAAVGGFQLWKTIDINQRTESSTLLLQALKAVEGEKADEADAILAKLAEDAGAGYSVLARFNRSAILAKKGQSGAAAEAYLRIAEDDGVDKLFRDLASVLSVLHDLDGGDSARLQDRLAPLMKTSNPWRHSAKELTALLARKSGDVKRARTLYRELTDDGSTPAGIRARAAEMTAILGG
ncbi:MAG: tetratricopeptide repeat protein [Rhodospirillales bacterium]|nr:tetratricopeptide repeat protein [Rhodospirillales bacterium]